MRVFIVLHKPTNKYLPPVKSMKGATTQELAVTPRVFYRAQDAICAARWWADGTAGMEYLEEWETGDREPIGVGSIPVEGRQLSDLRLLDAIIGIIDLTGKEIKPL